MEQQTSPLHRLPAEVRVAIALESARLVACDVPESLAIDVVAASFSAGTAYALDRLGLLDE